MSFGGSSPSTPPDPDPRPSAAGQDGQEAAGSRRQEQKKIAGMYGRNRTILAGSNEGGQGRKTILGG